MEQYGREIIGRYEHLKSERNTLENVWETAFRYTFPYRGQGFYGDNFDGEHKALQAKADQTQIYDSTAGDSSRLLAASVQSGLTPANSQWFSYGVPGYEESDIPSDARRFFQFAGIETHTSIHSSNFDSETFELFLDLVIGGQAGLYIEDDPPGSGRLRFEFWPLSDLYVTETLKRGYIDTVYRCLPLTPAQAIKKFGEKSLPADLMDEYKNNRMSRKKFEFIHCIRPRMKGSKQSQGRQARTMPWESTYVCAATGSIVAVGGYHEFPVPIPRWFNIPKTAYAHGPFELVRPDVLTLNKLKQQILTSGEMKIFPPFVVKNDGILNPSTVKIGSKKIIPVMNVENIKPLLDGGDFKVAEWLVALLQQQIRRGLMGDQLQPSDGPAMTAQEVHVRTQLARRVLGPVYGRLQTEFLRPLLIRCYGLLLRAGRFGTVPQSVKQLLGDSYPYPVYMSPLARAQRLEDMENMEAFEKSMVVIGQISPEVLDIYDAEKAQKKKAALLSVPSDTLRTEDEIRKLRRDRAKAQEEQRQAAMQQELMAKVVNE